MTTKKTNRTEGAAAEIDRTEILDSITDIYTNGVQRLADVQKKSLDVAVKQNAELLETWKKFAQTIPGGGGMFMVDLAYNAFERFAETQKGVIDLVLEQNNAF